MVGKILRRYSKCQSLEFGGKDAYLGQYNAPVAQLDRASDFGSEGWGFDSLRVYNNEA
jgi:hypothetical protein